MSSAAYIERARGMARFLEDREAHLIGDRERARERLETRYGIAGNIFYSLRYRPPKEIAVDLYDRLCMAVEDAAGKQIKALENEIAEARASRNRVREGVVRKAETLLTEAIALLKQESAL